MNDRQLEVVELDHLIVGGGIQGLTMLDELVAAGARRILLVTRDLLGVGESLHSHGYMQLGYTLPSANARLGRELAECGARWWQRIEQTGSSYLTQPPTYYSVHRADVAERLEIWDELGLAYEALDGPPVALQGGAAADPEVHHFQIRDRTLSMRELIRDLAAPHQERIVHGELSRIVLDESGRRVMECRFAVGASGAETLVVRPGVLLLATGRCTQPLLRKALTPAGSRPLDARLRELNRIRYVPMLLVRGRHLPRLTAVLQSHSLSVATHPVTGDESMWIVTLTRDHVSDRGDFDEARESVSGPALRASLELLQELVPAARERVNPDLRFSFYFGGKIDHPEGGNDRYVGSCGLANLRVLWPGLWSLALANARTVVQELATLPSPRSEHSRSPLHDLRDLALTRGVAVGEERRLTDSQSWWSHAELAARLGLT